MKKIFNRNVIFNVVKAALFLVCIYSITRFGENPNQRQFTHLYTNYYFFYFTFQNVYLALIVAILGLLLRTTSGKIKERVFQIYNAITPVAIAFSIAVTLGFWTMYFVNKRMVIYYKFTLPGNETYLLTELGQHLFPIILLLLEQYDVKLVKSSSQIIFMTLYLIYYCSAVEILKMKLGKYIYPGLKVFSENHLFPVFFFGLSMCFYLIYRGFISLKTQGSLKLRILVPVLDDSEI